MKWPTGGRARTHLVGDSGGGFQTSHEVFKVGDLVVARGRGRLGGGLVEGDVGSQQGEGLGLADRSHIDGPGGARTGGVNLSPGAAVPREVGGTRDPGNARELGAQGPPPRPLLGGKSHAGWSRSLRAHARSRHRVFSPRKSGRGLIPSGLAVGRLFKCDPVAIAPQRGARYQPEVNTIAGNKLLCQRSTPVYLDFSDSQGIRRCPPPPSLPSPSEPGPPPSACRHYMRRLYPRREKCRENWTARRRQTHAAAARRPAICVSCSLVVHRAFSGGEPPHMRMPKPGGGCCGAPP